MKQALVLNDIWQGCLPGEEYEQHEATLLIPYINYVACTLRGNGLIIIHLPHYTTEYYSKSRARNNAKKVLTKIHESEYSPDFKKQHDEIDIHEEDYLLSSNVELVNFVKRKKLDHIYVAGFHLNACIGQMISKLHKTVNISICANLTLPARNEGELGFDHVLERLKKWENVDIVHL